jgi:hypothetical protein
VNTDKNANVEDFLEAALNYGRRGWAVLPLTTPAEGQCSCKKSNCGKAGKHPRTRSGVNDATTDESVIQGWWNKWPAANIGIATGSLSGLVVLDLDERNGISGSASLSTLEREYSVMPETLACSTGTGRHLYFHHPGGPIGNRVGSIGVGLDVRSDGGYVVAPPSLHANGKRYSWIDPDARVAEPPQWLLDLLGDDRCRGDSQSSTIIPIGSRNDGLARLAGTMRARGMDRGDIETALVDANATRLQEPLPLAEVRSIAASISRYPRGRSRLPWFQFFPTDWFAANAVRLGRDYQRGWYIQLLAECWRRGGMLPDDSEMLWRLAGAESRAAFENASENLLVLDEFELVQLEDGAQMLLHPWMAEHYKKQAKAYEERCRNSALGVAAQRKARNLETALDEAESTDRPVYRPVTESEPELEPESELEVTSRG